MRTTSEKLITDLIEHTRYNMNRVQKLSELSTEALNHRTSENSWSILECIEHLNLYGDYYVPEIDAALHRNNSLPAADYKAGRLGNYFANSMLPKEKLNKMKTFKDKDPIGSSLNKSTLEKFLNQQKRMLELLNRARKVNLEKTKVPISLTKWIKLKLGDTFRFVIYHNERHLVQAYNVLKDSGLKFPDSERTVTHFEEQVSNSKNVRHEI